MCENCLRILEEEEKAPSAPYVRYLVKKVKETGILIDKPKREKPKHEIALCWLIRLKARDRAPGQTSKQNTKSISSAISSQQISGKTSESK